MLKVGFNNVFRRSPESSDGYGDGNGWQNQFEMLMVDRSENDAMNIDGDGDGDGHVPSRGCATQT